MSRYTMELSKIENELSYNILPSNFPFYIDSYEARKIFIDKFYDMYRFNEIGFETVARFRKALESKLNIIMPYYEQLYKTELESKNINFLLNKDLIETFERDVKNCNTSHSNSSTSASANTSSNGEDMVYDTPISAIDDITKYPTNASNSNSSASSDSEANSHSNQCGKNYQKEGTTLISKGNIGITSSAQLLKEWRDVLINIAELILKDLEDLFFCLF